MALDIGLAKSKTIAPYPTMSLSFDDDGYYWFCHPFFEELALRTGEMIDLYGGAWFEGAHIDPLETTLEAIRSSAQAQPAEWRFGEGSAQSYSGESIVRRAHLLMLLERFQSLVDEARARAMWIACLGD